MVLGVLLQIVLLAVLVFTIFVKYKQRYWKNRKGINQLEPTFFIGNISFKEDLGSQLRRFYEKFKAQGVQHGGVYFFLRPLYVPMDLGLIRSIMVKDFNHFVDRGFITVNEEKDPLTAHLVHLEGEKWKHLRTKLTPTFTSGKMKMMFQTFLDCTKGLEEMLDKYADSDKPVEIKDVLQRFTTDIIGSCAFGIECNTMKTPDSDFRKYMKKLFSSNLNTQLRLLAVQLFPKHVLNFFHIKAVPNDVENFFMSVVKQTVDYREKNHIYRKDFMHSMLQLKNMGKVTDDERFTDADGTKRSFMNLNEVSAQCFVFFVGGFETSSTTMNFAFYELSRNEDVQERLRKEVNEVLLRHNYELTYESISEMTYLDHVVKETLRKYPPLAALARKCTVPYNIPGTDIVLDKGTRLQIPVLGIHMDPDYYPNPEKFDPDRFTTENEMKRPPFTWLPFGEGPRQCIGLRFGLLQSKLGIAAIIRKFKVTLNNKTQTPLKMDPTIFITTPLGGIWLNITNVD